MAGLGWPVDQLANVDEVAIGLGAVSPAPHRPGLGWPGSEPDRAAAPSESSGRPDAPRELASAGGSDADRQSSAASSETNSSPDNGPEGPGGPSGPGQVAVSSGTEDDLVSRETTDPPRPYLPEAEAHTPVHFSPRLPRPAQTRVFVVANQKGGVGKTTTAVNLAAALAGSGARVLVVDLDPQGNASTALGIDHTEGLPNIYDVVVEGEPMGDFVYPVHRFPTLFGVPATIDLSGAELELASVVAREARLKKALDAYLDEQASRGERYDYVLIDCPPSLGLLTMNALVAGREVLVPIQCEYYALEGVETLFRIVNLVQQLNPGLVVSTVILTMYDARTRLSAQVAENARESLGHTVLRSAIPRSVRISEAPSFGQTVMTWDPGSPGALSYLEAARELALRDPTGGSPSAVHNASVPTDSGRAETLGSASATGID